MDDFQERLEKLSPKRLQLLALELHEQVEALRDRAREPIAVVGMACRFPGGSDDIDAFWNLLDHGRDAIRDVPRERWDIDALFDPDPDAPARVSTRGGGFIDDVSGFDAAFFGISPREAQTMDPQQRLLMEVAWEALEHAGIAPERLAGTDTGVYVGVCNIDHTQRVLDRGVENIDAYLASGNAHSVVAGRISYFMGFQGPALAVDTACSSSLVALHLAVKGLRNGESRVALAAGVNLMCSVETTMALTKAHMLAPDARCKTFDAAADGFSRGEGCGVVVLKRLSDARADGDRVLAVIRGTALNQDGRSGGLTVPNGPAQEAVIRAALADAGLAPCEIDYVEAHGTGTTLGDPIEVRALAGALGPGRPRERPLLIGSVKTNVGHLESAAGIAGVIKLVLSLVHERIPPHLHFNEPSPHIAWADYPVKVTAEGAPWKRGVRPRLAGVSSFGFSGTNAHVILEEAPREEGASRARRPQHCIVLSARSATALAKAAERWADAMGANPGMDVGDVAHTAAVGRSHFMERLAVVAGDAQGACEALRSFAKGSPHSAVHCGQAVPGHEPEVVFLFTGQGAQYPGMAKALYDASPVFRDVIDRCDKQLGADTEGRTLRSVLTTDAGEASPIHETSWTQPALFAVEYGLATLWRSWGVEPAAVIGHSVGEYVAACVAGVFTLEEGISLIAERGRLMQALPSGGTMAAVFADCAEIERLVAGTGGKVAIAAINAADSVVISGEEQAVGALLEELDKREVKGHRLQVSLAAHSPLVDPALDAMEAAAGRVTMRAPAIPVAWNVTGGEALPGNGAPDARYWRRHLREPVRFGDGIARLYREGYRVFLEVGPHPTLLALAQRTLPEEGTSLLGSLRRGKDDWSELLSSVAKLHVHGAPIDWVGMDAPYGLRTLPMPTYPFERRKFWIPSSGLSASRTRAAALCGGNPLFVARLPVAPAIFETVLTPRSPAWLGEHRVHGTPLVAGPVFIELVQSAAAASGEQRPAVAGFVIREPLFLCDEGCVVQVQLAERSDEGRAFNVYSRAVDAQDDDEWKLNASGRIVPGVGETTGEEPLPEIDQRLGASFECASHYRKLAALGIDLGPSFQPLRQARRRDGESLAWIALPVTSAGEAVVWAHPILVDGALQAVGLALPDSGDANEVFLLTGIEYIELTRPLPKACWAHVRLHDAGGAQPAAWCADVYLRGTDGAVLGTIRNVTLRRASKETLLRAADGQRMTADDLYYRLDWEVVPVRPAAAASLQAPAGFAAKLRESFDGLAKEHDLAIYAELLPELDRLSRAHIEAALRELGFDAGRGRWFDHSSEVERLHVAAQHERLFARLLDILCDVGVLAREGSGFRVVGQLDTTDPCAAYDALLARFGTVDGELRTLRRCGAALARVLEGSQDPVQLLFPDGSFAEARNLYVESPFARTYNRAITFAIREAIACLPAGAKLRILEIGAGTGGTTTYILPELAVHNVEYTFTDLSPIFLERAKEQFAAFPFVKYALLDIERDPDAQGFPAGKYDIVVAANVLHATLDLSTSVAHARDLLAPGGLMFLLEGVAPERWVDLTFGLTAGWWRFADTGLRPCYPLVDRVQWRELLSRLRFDEIVAFPEGVGLARGPSQQAIFVARAPAQRRSWTLVGDDSDIGDSLAKRLEARGDSVVRLAVGEVAGVDADTDVVYLGALALNDGDAAGMEESCERLSCTAPLQLLALLSAVPGRGKAWLITRSAHAVRDADRVARWQAPLWGVGRVFALEQPERWGGLIDLPGSGGAEALADAIVASLDAGDGEDQVAWRDGARLAARLRKAAAPALESVAIRGDATYLVTGGYGGLGLLVGRWLAQNGARHVALLGRNPVDPENEGVRAIEDAGARVIALAGDVADEEYMNQLVSSLAREAPPLAGIIHAAADLSTAPIGGLDAVQVSRMFRPKVKGTVLLERLARAHHMDFLVLFSSTTALLGASGFAHYAAANAFLDASAHEAHDGGLRVLSVNWGTWEVMRLASPEAQRSFREGGLVPMAATEALQALGRLLAGNEAQVAVARIDWDVLKPLHEARRARPMLAHVGQQGMEADLAAAGVAVQSVWVDRLQAAGVEQRHELLLEFVRGEVAAVLGIDSVATVSPEAGLFELGMDSLMSVELRRRLAQGIGRNLPSTLTFNYPNAGALADFLARELDSASGGPAETIVSVPPVPPASPADDRELSALTDEELEARLLARLEQTK
jgi:acyl transferase domain-containing protein/SAM-dependent methyltransferase/acyl carrier protein